MSVQIEEEIIPGLSEEVWSEIDSISYGEFMQRLQSELDRVRDSGFRALSPDAFVIPWLVRHFSSHGNAYVKRRYSGLMFVRDQRTVEAAWMERNLDIELVARVSAIVMKECQWPNALFVPEDRSSIVFTGQDMQPNTMNVATCIKEELHQNIDSHVWAGIDAISYHEFIERIRSVLRHNSDSYQ